MDDPTEAEREVANSIALKAFPHQLDMQIMLSNHIAQALATAREAAQREAEARLVEMREKAVAEIRRIRENYPQASTKQAVLALAERAIHTLPLPGAERWVKLREAARDVARHRPGWALPNALHEALAAFEQERT